MFEAFAEINVRVQCLDLGGGDLTNSARRVTIQVIAAVAGFERDRLVERIGTMLRRPRSNVKRVGRPASLSEEQEPQAVASRIYS